MVIKALKRRRILVLQCLVFSFVSDFRFHDIIDDRPFPTYLVSLFVQNLANENEFDLDENKPVAKRVFISMVSESGSIFDF